ncbi:hypothetical protein RAH41_18860 [Gottfriedia acidiceleris]|uniref:hypothetical protein n=1 Tax=Gottfriedia acidiceleris TaxID=371036 RepID=UPI002F25ED82
MFKELQEAFGHLEFSSVDKDFGNLISISAKEGISFGNQISLPNNNLLFTLKVYEDTIPINLFVEIDSSGNILNILKETEGTMPEIFISPNDSVWSINTCLDDRKNMEIIIPLLNRSEVKKEYKYRSFVGEWIGNIKNTVIFFNNDLFGKKPDQLCKLEFRENTILKREIVKIRQPKMNKVHIDHQDSFQLLAWHDGKLLHRNINQKGEILDERFLEVEELNDVEVLRLSFENNTDLIGFDNNLLFRISFTPNGDVIRKKLIELGPKSFFYTISTPIKINSKNYLIRFVGENFNGWAVIDLDNVFECYICYKDSNSYKDIMSDKVIELPKSDENHFVISGVSVNNNETYQVTVYNSNQKEKAVNQLYIISR